MVGAAMVAPLISPRRGKKPVDNAHEHSPTRVADFGVVNEEERQVNNNKAPVEELMLGPLSSTPSNNNVEEIPTLSIKTEALPPLIETASVSSSEIEADEREDSEDDVDFYTLNSPRTVTSTDKTREKPPTAIKTSRDAFMELKGIAANLAARGQEAEGLKAYTRALRLMRSDLSKIKKSMKNAHESTIASMQTQLYQAWVQVASEIAEIRTTMAILSERQGDYETAIKSCEEARIVYQSYANLKTKVKIGNDDEDDKLEQTELMLEKLALAKASYAGRKNLHQEVATLRSCLCSEVDPDVKEELYEDLFQVLTNVLEMEEESLGKIHPQVADTIALIAQVHADRGEMKDAIETMHSSVSIMRMALGPLHPRGAVVLRDLARLYESEDSDTAIQVYEAAIEAFRGSYGDHHAMIGSTLNNVAVIYIQREDLDEAVQKLSDALAAYETGVERGNAINPEVAQVWKNLGECYSLRDEWESALFAYTSALGVQQDARRCHDVLDSTSIDVSLDGPIAFDGADDASYADTLLRLANATTALDQHDEAVQTYEEALHIYRLMLHKATVEAGGHPSTEMVEAQDRVAHTLYCIAETQSKNVQYDEAVALYTEAFDLRLRSDAVRADRRANMVHCAMCLAGIGSVHMQQLEYTDACLVLKESLHFLEAHGVPHEHEIFDIIARRLAIAERGFLASSSFAEEDDDDDVTVFTATTEEVAIKEDRTLVLDMEAQEQTERGDYDAAIKTLTKTLAIRRKRLTKRLRKYGYEPNLKERNDVAKSIGNFAAVHYMKEDLKQAEALFTEAIRVYRSNGVEDKHPNIQGLLQGLQEIHEKRTC